MKLKTLVLSAALFLSASSLFSQVLTFNVKTVNYSSQAHVMAIWITDANNKFVKTILKRGTKYNYELYNWIASSSSNVTDATTGATISTHPSSAVAYTWNCKNVAGTIVADGNYYVNVEFVEEAMGGSGMYVKFPFAIGPAATQSFTSPTTSPGKYFQNVSYSITASATPINEAEADRNYNMAYNAATKSVQVKYDVLLHKDVAISVFDTKGVRLIQQKLTDGSTAVSFAKLPKGTYITKVTDGNSYTVTKKFVVR